MITIKKSSTADTRTCDWANVTKQQLAESSFSHIEDVKKALALFRSHIEQAGVFHDMDKITGIDQFHADFVTGFDQTGWWDNHRKITRHHLLAEDGIPEDVNLIDVLEMIADCVMAGMARSGSVFPLDIKPDTLMRAFQNTAELLEQNVEVQD